MKRRRRGHPQLRLRRRRAEVVGLGCGRLVELRLRFGLAARDLGHDLSGTDADQSQIFGYNAASQIVSRTGSDAYAWTGAVNVSRAYTVNGLNQYTAAGSGSLGYDLNGNLSSSPDMVGGTSGTTSYTYDAENRLVAASGLRTASLTYDPLGRLFQTSDGNAGTTQFLYDGDELVAEYDQYGNILRRYVHGTGVDDPVVWYQGSGLADRRSLFADHQGSIVAVANGSGAMLQINAYDPWGVPGGEITSRFAYTGQAWLPELGMYHYKARVYSPTLGRFLQTDPIGYDDNMHLYGYVANDPLNKNDPTGLAELNLVRTSDKLHEHGELVDFPGAFTIYAHSGLAGRRHGVEDQRKDGIAEVLNPKRLLEAARAGPNPYRGGPTLLVSCSISFSFAQQYADVSGNRVVASPGLIESRRHSETRFTLTAQKGFYAFDPQKNRALLLGNTIRYDAKTGIGTISTMRTGSLVPEQKRVCLQGKCEG